MTKLELTLTKELSGVTSLEELKSKMRDKGFVVMQEEDNSIEFDNGSIVVITFTNMDGFRITKIEDTNFDADQTHSYGESLEDRIRKVWRCTCKSYCVGIEYCGGSKQDGSPCEHAERIND